MSRFAERVPAPSPRSAASPRRQAAPARVPLSHTLQLRAAQAAKAKAAARDGLPANLKAGVERLSGIAMSDVRVHRNSPEPAKLGALAYAQGTDIHLGPGQDRQLPHEAWHVVQQKQGRVRPTLQMQSGVPVNDDAGLEREADVMGARAASAATYGGQLMQGGARPAALTGAAPVQRRVPTTNDVPGTTRSGHATIFDTKVGYGPLFEQTLAVKNHDAATVIAAYHKAITPIGNALAGVRYTDVGITKFPNGVPAMPLPAPANVLTYLTTVVVGVGTVQSWLDVPSAAAMSKLFEDDLDWNSVKTRLGHWFVGRELLLDNKYVGLVDPLIVRMTFRSQERGQQDWVLDTQFAESGKGYIVRIQDGQNNISGSIVTAPAFAAAANPPAPAVAAAAPGAAGPGAAVPVVAAPPPTPAANADDYIYSSTHVGVAAGAVVAGGPGTVPLGERVEALRAFQNGDTRVGQHDALDAFTLFAAEGARFRPVAELGASATLNAGFFTKPKAAWKDAHGVSLLWLYQNWGLRFGSAYDVTKETMAAVVDAHGPAIAKKPAKPNYNLTTGVMERR